MSREDYQKRLNRVNDAIALKEPDTIPFMPIVQCFPYLQAGYSMADILYDTDLGKTKKSLFQYLDAYTPDAMIRPSSAPK